MHRIVKHKSLKNVKSYLKCAVMKSRTINEKKKKERTIKKCRALQRAITCSIYGRTTYCLNKASASPVLSISAYVLRHWRSIPVLPVSSPDKKEPSRLYWSVVVITAILWTRQNITLHIFQRQSESVHWTRACIALYIAQRNI